MDKNSFIASVLIILQTLWWFKLFFPKKARKAMRSTQFILFASETGQAQKLAQETHKQLCKDGKNWQCLSMMDYQRQHSNLDSENSNDITILFIVSTTGDGDAPENGMAFFKGLSQRHGKQTHLRYAILALGDREYNKFCQFGIDLDKQLKRLQAQPLFELIKVDNLHRDTLAKWSTQLADTFSVADVELSTNLSEAFTGKLIKRTCINPNSPAEGLYDVQIDVPTNCIWQAGDIVQIAIPQKNAQNIMREYSIANACPAQPQLKSNETVRSLTLKLLVRQLVIDIKQNTLGKGSGFLTKHAELGQSIELRIRVNTTFKLPSIPVPMIFIATGSGLAGIASLIDEADARWSKPFNEHQGGHWLIYGERYPEHERPYSDELTDWQTRGVLKKITYCFSRDQNEEYPKYVQDAITQHADDINTWLVEKKAYIYVCGSKDRLGKSIPDLLTHIVGDAELVKARLSMDVY